MLEIKNIWKTFNAGTVNEKQALRGVSLTLKDGDFCTVIGGNGAGKSTMQNAICGTWLPDAGEILLDGIPVAKGSSGIGYMLQRDHLFEWRTIFSNASLGLEVQGKCDPGHIERLRELLDAYGLQYFYDARPSELSGGMRQRAALIRTLALEPDLLLLDEPFSALDYQTRLSVCDDISSIIRSRKKTAILITHDLSEAVSAADRILVLTSRPGRIKGELLIRFPDHETSPLKRRNYPEFSSYFNELWRILGNSGEGDEMALDGNDRKYGGVPLKDENDGPKCGIGGGADEIS